VAGIAGDAGDAAIFKPGSDLSLGTVAFCHFFPVCLYLFSRHMAVWVQKRVETTLKLGWTELASVDAKKKENLSQPETARRTPAGRPAPAMA
jgi:hypothetical protein